MSEEDLWKPQKTKHHEVNNVDDDQSDFGKLRLEMIDLTSQVADNQNQSERLGKNDVYDYDHTYDIVEVDERRSGYQSCK